MKFLFDLFPVLLFFGVFMWAKGSPEAAQAIAERYLSAFTGATGVDPATAPIILATAVAIIASFAQIIYLKLRRKKVEPMVWVSLIIIVLFGGATIYFSSEDFIKWKPTVLYWLFGLALLISQLIWHKNLIRVMMEKQIKLPDPVWTKLNYAWVVFFAVMGVINLYVAFWGGYETSTWVSFKLFGGIGLMFAFVIAQSLYLSKYIKSA